MRHIDRIKKAIKKYFFPEMIQDSFDFTHPFGIPDLPKLYVRSFGKRNPDKIFLCDLERPSGVRLFFQFYANHIAYNAGC